MSTPATLVLTLLALIGFILITFLIVAGGAPQEGRHKAGRDEGEA